LGNKTPLWAAIARALKDDISEGRYAPGDKLPTDAALADRFGVNRHTVRHALAGLVADGLVRTRRGSGAYVAARPTDYPIGRRVRFHQNIRASGRLPQKRVLRLETRPADGVEADALKLRVGAPVLVYEGLSLANGAAVAHFLSVFPAERLPGLAETFDRVASVTDALRLNGVEDYTRAETRVSAERASPTQALHLGLREGDPLLRTVGVNVDADGVPVERGMTWFAGDRVVLTMTPE